MTIKRFTQKNQNEVHFFLEKKMGIIVIIDNNSEVDCLYLNDPSKETLTKLHTIERPKEVKFLGDQDTLDQIKELSLDWPNFEREYLVEDSTEVIFFPSSGKVRVKKKDSETKKGKKKVLIVDDSKTIQKLLTRIISPSEHLIVMGQADCPEEARKIIEKEVPDLVTLDIHMPGMNGVEFLKTYLKPKSIPTIMISSVSMNEGPLVMEALSSGAITYIQKPSIDKLQETSLEILSKIEAIASRQVTDFVHPLKKTTLNFKDLNGLITIGSSTGGPQALELVLRSLPKEIPPIVIVQHIPAFFSKALAERLDSLCDFKVKEAEDGDFLKENTVYIAPGGKQMKLAKRGDEKRVILNDDPPLNRFRPSVDYLFNSLPSLEEENLISIILTGMGKDGAQGLLKVKESGGFTFAQDEASSVVFGMPKEAIRIGAANKIISLSEVSSSLITQYNKLNNKIAA